MRQGKKIMPLWLVIIIDLFIVVIYVGGFYGIYYRIPRQLNPSSSTTVSQLQTVEVATTEASVEASSATTEDAENVTTSQINTSSESGINTSLLNEKFAEYFSDEVVSTDTNYSSKNIAINVEKYTKGTGDDTVTYYVADVYLKDITSLQSGFAENTYGIGYTDTVLSMDEDLAAILAINGDYYGNGNNGVVIRNGVVYRDNSNGMDVCVLYNDGTMKTYSAEEFDAEQAVQDGAWQAWCFGPELLDESGDSMNSFTTDNHIARTNPRSVIGYYEPGHYCFVLVDGRQSGYSIGMTLEQLSELMEELGCSAAYNLDGGKSSSMTFDDAEVNRPCDGGREVSDCILIKEVE